MTESMNDRELGALTVDYLDIESLRLDGENPRFPLELRGSTDQAEIAINMAEIFDALEVARSMARFGFYPWEAFVVIPESGHYIVVEGNRRLTALRGLIDPALRE